jgi:hypothetical protein
MFVTNGLRAPENERAGKLTQEPFGIFYAIDADEILVPQGPHPDAEYIHCPYPRLINAGIHLIASY